MLTLKVKNVNEALPLGLFHLKNNGVKQESRAGATLEYPEPVCTTYLNPTQRVLINEKRDANPFFHLFEGLWIIGGCNDVKFLAQFNSRMAEYSDDGETFHAAYGHRLRKAQHLDQIETVVNLLRMKPDTRQAVLQIWDARLDLAVPSKDIPCNDLIMLKIRDGKLNMTIANRSNDVIWGAYGANAVHFSMLQEYIADKVGVEVGVYNQVSDSYHVYTDNPQWELLKDLSPTDWDPYREVYQYSVFPMRAAERGWHTDLMMFLSDPFGDTKYVTEYFNKVVQPMALSWQAHKQERKGMIPLMGMANCDWKIAAGLWLERRYRKEQ